MPDAAPPPAPTSPAVIDVSGLIMGRAASLIAQRLLAGEDIIVIRAEKAVVTGSRASVLETYRANRARGSVRSGPHYPRNPDRIFRRAVRGMLPHLKSRGKAAFDRLTVYIGCPEPYAKLSASTIPDAQARPTLRTPLTLEEVARLLGARL
ncbi:MAG: 50S ribosomal protein L13 [Thermoplasmata archaeon]|nr:50S ribosomal protein L13 [Thermoplasmata archaeon]